MTRRSTGCVALLLMLVGQAAPAAHAGVNVGFDVATLNELIPAVMVDQVVVPIAGSSVSVHLEDVKVLGFDPADGEHGSILTSLRLSVPDLGLSVPVEPKLTLAVDRTGEEGVLVLRFAHVPLRIPLAGSFDLSSFLPPMRFPADNVWEVADGTANVKSRLTGVQMGRSELRFTFEVTALAP